MKKFAVAGLAALLVTGLALVGFQFRHQVWIETTPMALVLSNSCRTSLRRIDASGTTLIDINRGGYRLDQRPSPGVLGREHPAVTDRVLCEMRWDFWVEDISATNYEVEFEASLQEPMPLLLNGVLLRDATSGIPFHSERVALPPKYLKPGIPNELILVAEPPSLTSKPWAVRGARLVASPKLPRP